MKLWRRTWYPLSTSHFDLANVRLKWSCVSFRVSVGYGLRTLGVLVRYRLDQRGRWRLREREGEGTEVSLRISYQAPGGILGLIALILLVAADDVVHHRGPAATWSTSLQVILAPAGAVALVSFLQTTGP